jgi:rare lipoprotein A
MKSIATALVAMTLLTPPALAADRGYRTQIGVGSTYGWKDGFHNRRTASGEIFNQWAFTAASRGLPFGTWVKVTNITRGRNYGKSTLVRITDRGPFVHGRILDISTAAARAIGMDGIAQVKVEVVRTHRD